LGKNKLEKINTNNHINAVESFNGVISEIRKTVVGKDDIIKKILITIISGGHILLDDIPGVGKTTMAVAFSKALSLRYNRMQFTPDVMPSDIVGFSLYNKETGKFEYKIGVACTNLFLADEINRTSSKTQSALLELMEEKKVTVDGTSYKLPDPYIVIATQNPMGMVGTHSLPESQLDRFMVRLSMGYPTVDEEAFILKSRRTVNPLSTVKGVIDGETLIAMREMSKRVHVHDEIYTYMAQLADATRKSPKLRLGISPRGSIALSKIAMTVAMLNNRDWVEPQDVAAMFTDVMSHRVIPKSKVDNTVSILTHILKTVPAPKI
jgi:MoxR-like ATPase